VGAKASNAKLLGDKYKSGQKGGNRRTGYWLGAPIDDDFAEAIDLRSVPEGGFMLLLGRFWLVNPRTHFRCLGEGSCWRKGGNECKEVERLLALWANSKKAKKGAQEMNVYCIRRGWNKVPLHSLCLLFCGHPYFLAFSIFCIPGKVVQKFPIIKWLTGHLLME
jgi:hypothetical protein